MAETTTITVRIPVELREKLDRLAGTTKRSRSYLAAEALGPYLAYELDIVEGILRGMEDAKAGRVTPHSQVMDELDTIVEAARQRQQRKSA